MTLYVQFGSGPSGPDGWVNFDASPTLRLQKIPVIGATITKSQAITFPKTTRYGDVVAGLPLQPGTVDGMYGSHVLEHLSHDDCLKAIRHVHALLKPGGLFRLIVPDLKSRAEMYLELLAAGEAQANSRFMRAAHLGRPSQSRSLKGRLRTMLGNSDHLWMWDEPSMTGALAEAGFTDIRRCAFNDCEDPAFLKVESESRFYWSPDHDPARRIPEIAMEARKPDAAGVAAA